MSHLKTLHHPEYYQVERIGFLEKRNGFKPEQACLMKYFPKHYRKLKTDISMKAWSLISKLQKTKTINHFESLIVAGIPQSKPKKAMKMLEQRIFRNKRKSTKSVPLLTTNRVFFGSEKKAQLSDFYPMITSLNLMQIKDLNLSVEEVTFIDRRLEQDILDCYNYFWKSFRNVRHLQLSTNTRYSWFIIKEINSTPHFLSRLKTLGLSLRLEFNENNFTHPRNVLKELSKNAHFLSCLTHLDCGSFEGFQHYDGFVCLFLGQCPNLVSMNFPIGREAHRYSSPEEIYKECQDTGALEEVAKMKNLQELTVSVYGIKTFINHLSLPKSLQKVVLNVFHSFYDSNLLDLFESKFFECWRELSHLQTLKIKMRRTLKSNKLLDKFVLPLLQMTPNLKSFRLRLVNSPAFDALACEKLNLSLFHERVAALKELESFKISNCTMGHNSHAGEICNLVAIDPKKCQFLLNLKKVNILSEFSEKFDFQDFACKGQLKISTFVFNSVEALSDCIKSANRAVSLRNFNLELKIMLLTENLEEISSSLKAPIILENNLIVRLDICWKTKLWGRKVSPILEQSHAALRPLLVNFDMKVVSTYF